MRHASISNRAVLILIKTFSRVHLDIVLLMFGHNSYFICVPQYIGVESFNLGRVILKLGEQCRNYSTLKKKKKKVFPLFKGP